MGKKDPFQLAQTQGRLHNLMLCAFATIKEPEDTLLYQLQRDTANIAGSAGRAGTCTQKSKLHEINLSLRGKFPNCSHFTAIALPLLIVAHCY
jgi:hypothetical protein